MNACSANNTCWPIYGVSSNSTIAVGRTNTFKIDKRVVDHLLMIVNAGSYPASCFVAHDRLTQGNGILIVWAPSGKGNIACGEID